MVTYQMRNKPLGPIALRHKTNIMMRRDAQCGALFEEIFSTNEVDPKAELKIDLD